MNLCVCKRKLAPSAARPFLHASSSYTARRTHRTHQRSALISRESGDRRGASAGSAELLSDRFILLLVKVPRFRRGSSNTATQHHRVYIIYIHAATCLCAISYIDMRLCVSDQQGLALLKMPPAIELRISSAEEKEMLPRRPI
ncbi:unnamed protein product [Trichogramma brassicae]|uniref:Uncharacterized protein n=1 Tax=Trichogramma brassicae TaxID=86971 RepID=A0A6H5ICD1_9HYME|nr:unnamed protein product [Trichogramma brassicae]